MIRGIVHGFGNGEGGIGSEHHLDSGNHFVYDSVRYTQSSVCSLKYWVKILTDTKNIVFFKQFLPFKKR